MSSNEFDEYDTYTIDLLIREQRLLVNTQKQAVERLLRTGFKDELIVQKFSERIRLDGVETALAIAQGRDARPRWLWYGGRRGHPLFGRAERAEATKAIDRLPAAMEELARQQDHLRDLEEARRKMGPDRYAAPDRDADRSQNRAQLRGKKRPRTPE